MRRSLLVGWGAGHAALPAEAPFPLRQQTITVTVSRKPTRAGIAPNHVLIDLKTDDNIKTVKIQN